jgi:hypothetical protein
MLGHRWDSRAPMHSAAHLNADSELILAIIASISVLSSKGRHDCLRYSDGIDLPSLLDLPSLRMKLWRWQSNLMWI